MRALFLTHYFPPEVGAPQTRIAALARGLSARGMDVTVHTGFPNYPTGTILAPYRNRPLLRELQAGTLVVRSAVYASPNAGFGRRLMNHASFAGSSLVTAAATGPADVVVAETPPLFLAAAAVPYAAAKRAPVVLNVADLWPDSAVALEALRNPGLIKAARALEEWSYRHAAAITVPTAGMVRRLNEREPAKGKTLHMPPAVDADRFTPGPPEAESPPLRVLYAGTVGLAHGLDALVSAARLAGPGVVHLTIAGEGAEAAALARRVSKERIDNVDLLGMVPADAVPALYRQAHAGVVLLRDRGLFADALPTKLLECMAAARPVVVSARGEAWSLVRELGAGLAVAPEDPGALAAAFTELAGDVALRAALGSAGRSAALHRFSRDASVDRWAALLERVADQRAR